MSTTLVIADPDDTLLVQLRGIVTQYGSLQKARPHLIKALKQTRRKIQNDALALLQETSDGLACAHLLSDRHDMVVQTVCQLIEDDHATNWPEGLGLFASGGYGRGELAPSSDLDLLFLLDKQQPTEIIELVLYFLWDCGWKVGHAVRTKAECLQLAAQDHTIATSMMDLRILYGPAALGSSLATALKGRKTTAKTRRFIADKLQERDVRHQRQGPTRYLVEPNVKAGKGGLRDLQSLIWIARHVEPEAFVSGGNKPKFFTEEEYRVFVRTNRFLWTVRCWLHFLSGRDEDRLTFDLQPLLAKKLQYRSTKKTPGVERLMKAYFLHAREVGFLTRIFCTKLEEQANKSAPAGLSRLLARRLSQTTQSEFAMNNGRLDFRDTKTNPPAMEELFRLFLLADDAGVELHPDALAHIRRSVPQLNSRARKSPAIVQVFLSCFTASNKPETLLRLMSEAGLLGKMVPEFGRITAQTQFNMYHSYTVDEHTLRAIGALRELETGVMTIAGLDMKAVLAKSTNRRVLYLAMLLHDTGKGKGDQEVEGGKSTRAACARLGLSAQEVELAGWLVEHHLLHSDTAQGRDLGDPETIARFANKIGSLERLRLLFAMTIADIRAVGPGVWTSWKGQLLTVLYMRTELFLLGRTGSARFTEAGDNLGELAKIGLKGALLDNRFFKYWSEELQENYWLGFTDEQLLEHAKFVRKVKRTAQSNGFKLIPGTGDEPTTLVVWADDRPGLFAVLCAVANACGASIVSARVFTTKTEKAFDVLYLSDGRGGPFAANNPRALARFEDMLTNFFHSGDLPQTGRRSRSRREAAFSVMREVVIDNEISARATLIECVGADRPELLRSLAQTLNQCRVNIRSAHIMTYGERAVDIFYVTEQSGEKIRNGRRLSHIRAKLHAALALPKTDQHYGKVEQAPASTHR